MTEPDPALDTPAIGPEYAGSADPGVVSSVGEHADAAGDVVEAVRAEHAKLQSVFEDMLAVARGDDRQALRLRWGGVVRELLEHETAQGRVVLPAAERVQGIGAVAEVRRRQDELIGKLGHHDALTADDISPQQVEDVIELAAEHLRVVDTVVVPLLESLPADERMRLGEDLRQVMG